jgi:hypothetical protein
MATLSVGGTTIFDGSALQSGVTGTLTTGVTFPAGHTLQVVSYYTDTQGSQTITTSDTVVNSMTIDVTPKGTNSDFLITVRWFGESATSWDTLFNIQMDGTRVNMVSTRGYGLGNGANASDRNNDASTPESTTFSTLVKNSSSVIGTDITFRLVADNYASVTLWNNRCFAIAGSNEEKSTSELIITEIAG